MNVNAPLRMFALALLLLALVAAGCGESEEEKFRSEVNEVCTDASDNLDSANGPEEGKDVVDRFLADLEDVDPPESLQEDFDVWLTDQRQIATEVKEALDTRDRERIERIDTSSADAKARELGLDDCAD